MKIKDNNLNWTLNVIARVFVGIVFLFSSFVKGVDPLGTSYKITEYLTAWSFFGILDDVVFYVYHAHRCHHQSGDRLWMLWGCSEIDKLADFLEEHSARCANGVDSAYLQSAQQETF